MRQADIERAIDISGRRNAHGQPSCSALQAAASVLKAAMCMPSLQGLALLARLRAKVGDHIPPPEDPARRHLQTPLNVAAAAAQAEGEIRQRDRLLAVAGWSNSFSHLGSAQRKQLKAVRQKLSRHARWQRKAPQPASAGWWETTVLNKRFEAYLGEHLPPDLVTEVLAQFRDQPVVVAKPKRPKRRPMPPKLRKTAKPRRRAKANKHHHAPVADVALPVELPIPDWAFATGNHPHERGRPPLARSRVAMAKREQHIMGMPTGVNHYGAPRKRYPRREAPKQEELPEVSSAPPPTPASRWRVRSRLRNEKGLAMLMRNAMNREARSLGTPGG